jgi:histidinol-phosphate phosphatase family protein
MPTKRAVFLDKDGTLVESVPFNVDADKVRLIDGAESALNALYSAGYLLFVISNQPGVAHGLFDEEALWGVEDRIRCIFDSIGVPLSGFYYCPHHPQGRNAKYALSCLCRKPAPGLIIQAASEHGINLSESWMIGDLLDDVEAGNRSGCRTILLDNGSENEWRLSPSRTPLFYADDLDTAARLITGKSLEVRVLHQINA